jgi:hypothetical protein
MPDGECSLSYPAFGQTLLDNENCEYMVDGDTITIATGETVKSEISCKSGGVSS